MDILQLPLLKTTDTIRRAMDYMKSADARAIVVAPDRPAGGAYILQMNAAVMRGFKDRVELLGNLQDPGIILPDLTDHPVFQDLKAGLTFRGPHAGVESLLDNQSISYAVAGTKEEEGLPKVTIVTRHERYAAQIQSANKVCVCDGPKGHTGDDPPHYDGEACDYCKFHYICR